MRLVRGLLNSLSQDTQAVIQISKAVQIHEVRLHQLKEVKDKSKEEQEKKFCKERLWREKKITKEKSKGKSKEKDTQKAQPNVEGEHLVDKEESMERLRRDSLPADQFTHK